MRTRPTLALILAALIAGATTARTPAAAPPPDARLAAHLLNRLGFGARPGDVARVQAIGALAFVDEQLHPERLTDAAMASRLDGFETLTLSSRQIAERYEGPLLERRRQKKAAGDDTPRPDDMNRRPDPIQRQANAPMVEVSQQKLLRAIYSERQLQEVLVDFWFNHFNVDARKGPVRFMITEYERDAIRPYVLGHFRDLLGATAKSPAMLFYLDNWLSADPETPTQGALATRRGPLADRLRARRLPDGRTLDQMIAQRMPRGLNENYGRELLELHTLGVDGGYTQKDVTEVARAFTGWTIALPRQGGGFRFVPARHDDGVKIVMGRTLKAGNGQRDGELVLDLLAEHPATARHIATALAQRFVSDTPPPALVDRVAHEFLATHGDLRAVMRVLLTSHEFLSDDVVGVKIKTPFDFIVSALRASGAEVRDGRALVRALQELGMPLYQCQPPTGYKDSADTWVNTGALVNRMNVALAIADGTTPGVHLPPALDAQTLLGASLTESTRATIAKATTGAQAVALALGSPEFQRR